MNVNIIAVTLSYLDLRVISDFLESVKKSNTLRKTVVLHLAYIHNTNYLSINGKINNYQFRCAICNKNLIGDYSSKLGFTDCEICGERKNFNLELCDECSGFKSKRGKINHKICSGGHTTLFVGINILSY